MNEQRRLDLALLSDQELTDLEESVGQAIYVARESGAGIPPSLYSLRVEILVEQALKAQEGHGGTR